MTKRVCELNLRENEPNLIWKLKFLLEKSEEECRAKKEDRLAVAWERGYQTAIIECLAQLGFDTTGIEVEVCEEHKKA